MAAITKSVLKAPFSKDFNIPFFHLFDSFFTASASFKFWSLMFRCHRDGSLDNMRVICWKKLKFRDIQGFWLKLRYITFLHITKCKWLSIMQYAYNSMFSGFSGRKISQLTVLTGKQQGKFCCRKNRPHDTQELTNAKRKILNRQTETIIKSTCILFYLCRPLFLPWRFYQVYIEFILLMLFLGGKKDEPCYLPS